MNIKTIYIAMLSLLIFTPSLVQAQSAAHGYWLTENQRSVIEMKDCDDGICGHVYWITDGGLEFDEFNPDEILKSRPICDLKVLWGFQSDGDGKWDDGEIYKADEGETFSGEIKQLSENQLKVRGYIGISLLGRSQVWTRVDPSNYKVCSAP